MRIVNLTENTEGASGCGCEHGLCFYIETEHHRLLMDAGQSDLFLRNADRLGIDLTAVDTLVLSHGHHDHGGGIPYFAGIAPRARIYAQESAFREYCSLDSEGIPHYIGLPEGVRELPGLVLLGGDSGSADSGIYRIDGELSIWSGIGNRLPVPSANDRLMVRTEEGLVRDDFRHEQCLMVTEGECSVLLSGCAHHGILNVMERCRELYGADPYAVISGFHMMKKGDFSEDDTAMIIDTALRLRATETLFYTGHCTGEKAYLIMKQLMKDQLRYVHSGDEIVLPGRVIGNSTNQSEDLQL